jgi:hypothetical protein
LGRDEDLKRESGLDAARAGAGGGRTVRAMKEQMRSISCSLIAISAGAYCGCSASNVAVTS